MEGFSGNRQNNIQKIGIQKVSIKKKNLFWQPVIKKK